MTLKLAVSRSRPSVPYGANLLLLFHNVILKGNCGDKWYRFFAVGCHSCNATNSLSADESMNCNEFNFIKTTIFHLFILSGMLFRMTAGLVGL